MKKQQQITINQKVLEVMEKSVVTFPHANGWYSPLYTCNARVYDTGEYYLLLSYKTIIASIDKGTGITYDYLRYVYGYTATSAQHISKFMKKYNSLVRYSYREV